MATKDFNILGLKVTTANNKKDIGTVSSYNSYVQKIEHICKLQKGEIPSDMNLGSDYYSLIFNPGGNKPLLQKNIENYIKVGIREITEVNVLVAYYDETKLLLNISFKIGNGIDEQKSACQIEVPLQ